MTLNAANRKDIRKAEKAAHLAETHDREALTSIMSTISGRAWMYRRLEDAHCFNDPFTGDALREAYHKGERNFGLRLFAQLMMYCPDAYIQMTREAHDRYNSNTRDPDDASTTTEHSGSEDGNGGTQEPNSTPDDSGETAGGGFDPEAAGWNLWRPGDIR